MFLLSGYPFQGSDGTFTVIGLLLCIFMLGYPLIKVLNTKIEGKTEKIRVLKAVGRFLLVIIGILIFVSRCEGIR